MCSKFIEKTATLSSVNANFRFVALTLFFFLIFLSSEEVYSQVAPSPCNTAGLGQSITSGLRSTLVSSCQPAEYGLNYRLEYRNPPPAGHVYDLLYDWADNTQTTAVITPADISPMANREITRAHTYPATAAACQYGATVVLRIDGQECPETQLSTDLASWATDDTNGGMVQFSFPGAPNSGNIRLEFCEGEDIQVTLGDATTLNCQANNQSNQEARDRQTIYNSGTGANKIPNVMVDGVMVTDMNGADVIANHSPDGRQNLPNPVTNASTIANLRTITAMGGFGAGFPTAGDEFQVQLHYWNICNPFNAATGTGNAVTATATIAIIAAPAAPILSDTVFCVGNARNAYRVTAMTQGNVANAFFTWYDAGRNVLRQGVPTLNPLDHYPNLNNNFRANGNGGTEQILATVSGTANGMTCVSPFTEVTYNIFPDLLGGEISIGPNTASSTQCGTSNPAPFAATAATGGDGTYAYQWQSSTDGVTYTDIPGATAATYDSPDVAATTWFRRRVQSSPDARGNSTLCKEEFSNVFQFIILTPLTPGTIGSDQVVCLGGNPPAQLTSTADPTGGSGTNYMYRWESTTNDPAATANPTIAVIPNTNANTYTPPANLAVTTWYRRAVDRGVCGTMADPRVETDWVQVTINSTVNGGMIQQNGGGNTATVCLGDASPTIDEMTAAAGGNGMFAYQWAQSSTAGGPYTQIAGETNQTRYSPPALTNTMYYVRTVNSGICSVNSNEVSIVISPLPTATISGGGSICAAAGAPNVTIDVQGPEGPWSVIYSIDGVNQTAVNVGQAGVANGRHAITNPVAGMYRLVSVTDQNMCMATTLTGNPNVVNATANAPTIAGFTAGPAVCDAGAMTNPPDGLLEFTPAGAVNYRIGYSVAGNPQADLTVTSDPNGIVNIPVGYPSWNNAPGTVRVVITEAVNTATGCRINVPANTNVDLVVNSVPVVTPNQVGTVCSGVAATHTIAMTGAAQNATEFSWTRAGVNTTVAATAAPHITDVLSNTTPNTRNEIYSVTPSTAICTGVAENVTIVVNPAPVIEPNQSSFICSGSSVAYTILMTNTPAGTAITWTSVATGVSTTVQAQNGAQISDVLDNTSVNKDDQTFRYNVSATSGVGCASAATEIVFTVHPTPVLGTNATKNICRGEPAAYPIALNPPGRPAGVTFSWLDPTSGNATSAAAGTAMTTHINDNYPNAGIQRYTVTATSADNCASTPQVIEINVNQNAMVTDQTIFVCETIVPGQTMGSGSASIDLTTLEAAIGRTAGSNLTWYSSYAPATGTLSAPIAPGTAVGQTENYRLTQDVVLYAEVSPGTGASCASVASVNLNYQAVPINADAITYTGSAIRTPDGDYNICKDDLTQHVFQTTPTRAVPGRASNATYAWDYPNASANLPPGFVDTGSSLTLVFPVANANIMDSVIRVTESHNGCAGLPKMVLINTESTAGRAVISGTDLLCAGSSNITYSVAGAPMSASYNWTLPAGVSFVPNTAQGVSSIRVDFSSQTVAADRDILQFEVAIQTGRAECVAQPANPYDVTVVQFPTMTSGNQATICSGATAASAVTLTSRGGPAGTVYNWSISNVIGAVTNANTGDMDNGVNTLGRALPLINRSGVLSSVGYTVIPVGPDVMNGGNSCQGTSQTVNIDINPEPVITPLQSKRVCSDNPINYEITLDPRNLPASTVFTWASPGAGAQAGMDVAAGTAGTNHILDNINNQTTTASTLTYSVTPRNTGVNPNCTGGATDIVITINPEPLGADDNVSICSNVALSYDLQDNLDRAAAPTAALTSTFSWSAADNPNVSGETTGVGTTNTITDQLINRTNRAQVVLYTVVPSNQLSATEPSCQGNAFVITVTVRPEPVGSNDRTIVCSGVALNYDLDANIAGSTGGLRNGITYTWLRSTNPDVTVTAGATNTANILDNITNATNVDQDLTYTVTPTHTDGNANTCVGDVFQVVATIAPEPRGGASSSVICSRETPNTNLQNIINAGNRLRSTFTWQGAANNSITGITTAPATSNSATIDNTLRNVTGAPSDAVYTVTPSARSGSGLTCLGPTFTVTITVNPEPVASVQPNTTICSSAAALNYDLQIRNIDNNPGGNSVASNFSWSAANNASVSGEQTSVQATQVINDVLRNMTNTASTVVYTVTPTSTLGACTGDDFDVNVVVNPEPVGSNAQITSCSGVALSYDLQQDNINQASGNSLNSTFVWRASPNANVGGLSNTDQMSNRITETITNVSTSTQNVVYTVTPTSQMGVCQGSNFQLTVQVHPQPQSSSTTSMICSRNSVNRNLASNITNSIASTYSFRAADNQNVAGESVTNTTSGTIQDILVNVSSTDQNVVYNVTPTSVAHTCVGASFTVTAVVHPEPVGTSQNQEICSNAPLSYNLQDNINLNNSVASTFTWRSRTSVVDVSGESTIQQTTGVIQDDLTNISAASHDVFYDIVPTNAADACPGSQFTLTLTVHPKPTANDATGLNICDRNPFDYDLDALVNNSGNGLTANTVYDWLALDNTDVLGESTTTRRADLIDDNLRLAMGIITDEFINYTVTPLDLTNNCSGDPFNVTVAIRPKPIGAPETIDLCSGVSLNFSLDNNINNSGNSFTANTTYEWSATDNANVTGESLMAQNTNTINDQLVNNSTNNQTVLYSYVPSNSNGCVGDAVAITVNVEPSPIMDPNLAQRSICSRSANNPNTVGVTLATTAASIPAVGYNVTNPMPPMIQGFTGTPTTGMNLAANAISGDAYNNISTSTVIVVYRVIPVSAGTCLGTPLDIRVTVHPEPVLNPNLAKDICSGLESGVTLSTNGASVAAASYTIENRTFSSTTMLNQAGANTSVGNSGDATLIERDVYTNTSNTDIVVSYSMRPRSAPVNGGGSCLGESQIVALTVKPQPDLDTTSPAAICSGLASGVILNTVATSVAAASYNLNGIVRSSTALIAGTNNASIALAQPANILDGDVFFNTTAGPLRVTYTIVPVSAENCLGDEGRLEVDINPAPAIADNLSTIVCNSENTGIILNTAAGVGAATYSITGITVDPALTPSVGNSMVGTGLRNDAIQADEFTNTTNDPLAVTYAITGSSAGNCVGAELNVVLTVEPAITATPSNNSPSICSDSNIDIELISPTNPTSGDVTFNYVVTSSSGGRISGFVANQSNLPEGQSIGNTLANTSDAPATITYSITAVANGAKNGSGCRAPQAVDVNVNIEPRPQLTATPPSEVVCEGTPTNVELTTTTTPSVGGVTFNVVSTTPTGGMTLTAPGTPATAYAPGDFVMHTWDNPTTGDQEVIYILSPQMDSGGACIGDDTEFRITIKPNPELAPIASLSVCSDSPFVIPLTFDLPVSSATWTPTFPASISGVTAGSGSRINATPINASLNPQTITYSVRPQLGVCIGVPIDIQVQVNPLPNTTGLPATRTVCNGETVNIPLSSGVPGATTFAWTVSDPSGLGMANEFDGNGTTISQQLDNTLGYQAILIYRVIPTSQFACVGAPSFMNLEVNSIVPQITPNRTQICSGESVQIVNTSLGAAGHRWFYRLQGSNVEQNITTDPSADYVLENNTANNPALYEVVYEASNGNCSSPPVVTPPISVYRSVTARFDEGTVPPIVGGVSNVNFTNTSNPVDNTDFRYEWNFGIASQPTQFTGDMPPAVAYSTRGNRNVVLRAVNNAAELAGIACEHTFSRTITVPVLALLADFSLDQPEICVPFRLTVTNTSTGDINEWTVLDENGSSTLTSNQDNPEFNINTSGEYTIFLTTRDSFTGQMAVINKRFVAYQQPIANFDARPSVVFVPNNELQLTNSSERANSYVWDFGDGESSTEETPVGHAYKTEGIYDLKLVAEFDYGNGIVCRDTTERRITARPGGEIRVPNAFTPSAAANQSPIPGINPPGGTGGTGSTGGTGTGFNDTFLPIVQGATSFNMQIYDRWGNLIFESNSATEGWNGRDTNGRLLPAGVYVYRLDVLLSDGNDIIRIGDVTMLR